MKFIDTLNREWAVISESKRTCRQMGAWQEGPLAQFVSPGDVVRFVHERDHPVESDQVLAVLAKRAPTDVLAARTLLQAVLPGLKSLMARYRHLEQTPDDLASVVVGRATEKIRTYPYERRPERIAANIVGDVRNALWEESRKVERLPTVEVEGRDVSVADDTISAADELVELVREAVSAGALSQAGGRLLVENKVIGRSLKELGAAEDVHVDALRQRRHRAERSLETFCAVGNF